MMFTSMPHQGNQHSPFTETFSDSIAPKKAAASTTYSSVLYTCVCLPKECQLGADAAPNLTPPSPSASLSLCDVFSKEGEIRVEREKH